MNKLSLQKENSTCRIVSIKGNDSFISKITAIGLCNNSEVVIIQNCKKYPLMISARDTVIALNKKQAENIIVEEVS